MDTNLDISVDCSLLVHIVKRLENFPEDGGDDGLFQALHTPCKAMASRKKCAMMPFNSTLHNHRHAHDLGHPGADWGLRDCFFSKMLGACH